jgi:hypothetical protein
MMDNGRRMTEAHGGVLGLRLASILSSVNHGLHRLGGFLELGLKEIVILEQWAV